MNFHRKLTAALAAGLVLVVGALSAHADPGFPASWAGYWQGSCDLAPVTGAAESVDMELVIERQLSPNDRIGWKMIYVRAGQREVRPYELAPVRGEPGHFLLDEKNGILIDTYYSAPVLWSQFEVSGSRITVREELQGEELRVEMTTSGSTAVRSSGGGETPPVNSYPLLHVQRCRLRRI